MIALSLAVSQLPAGSNFGRSTYVAQYYTCHDIYFTHFYDVFRNMLLKEL
jgi:hypothetical protein